jgi:hypothetical protein
MSRLLAGWRILGIFGLALIAGGGRPAGQEKKPALPVDLARIAPDAFLVEAFQIDAFWNGEAFKSMREKGPKSFPDLAQEFEKFMDVGITDVERVTLVMLGVKENSEPIVLILTKKGCHKDRVLKTVLPERTEKNTDKGTIHIGKEHQALSFPDDSPIILALLDIGQPAIKFLRPYLEDDEPVVIGVSTSVIISSRYKYRKCDFAAHVIARIVIADCSFREEPQERDRAIQKLMQRLAELHEIEK